MAAKMMQPSMAGQPPAVGTTADPGKPPSGNARKKRKRLNSGDLAKKLYGKKG